MKQFAAYCRVSTDRQKEEQTIEVQRRFIEEWAEKNEATIVKWYMDDGWSGDRLDRPDLDQLREDVGKNLWQGVIFIDRDRLARTLAYQEFVIRELRDKEIMIVFINNPLADTPLERAMQQVYGIVAEMERINSAERFRKGKIHKAKSGKIVGYNAPYGYRYILKSGNIDGYFIIHDQEAQIVRKIFEWVGVQGLTLRKVIKTLYDLNIKPPKGKSDTWKKSSIKRMLTRTDYVGVSYYNKTISVVPRKPQNTDKYKRIKKSSRRLKAKDEWISVTVPAIIDKDLFDKVQRRLELNITYNKRNKKYPYLLSGKVFCDCGSRRVGDGVNGHHYYRCAGRIYKYPLPHKCHYEGVNAEILDTMVWNKFVDLLSNHELIEKQTKKWIAKQSQTPKQTLQIAKLKETKNKLAGEEKRYIKAYGNNLMSFNQFEEQMHDLKAKESLINEEMNKLSDLPKENVTVLDRIPTVPYSFINTVKRSTFPEKQEYVRKLIDGIYVGERRNAIMKGHIPLQIHAQNIQYEIEYRHCRITKRRKINPF